MSDHRSSIIHSSYAQLPSTETISPDTRAPAIGIIVRSHNTPHKTTISVLVSVPRLSSLESGETIDLDRDEMMSRDSSINDTAKVETLVRQAALEIENRCRVLASELLKHADRMKSVATRSKLIDDVPTPNTSKAQLYVPEVLPENSTHSVFSRATLPPSLLSKLSRR